MNAKPWGGLGDELAMTAVVREHKRALPDEEIHLWDSHRPDIWKNNPHVGHGSTNNGKNWRPDFYSWMKASTPHAMARQLGFQLVDDTPEVWLTQEELDRDFGIKSFERTVAVDIEAKWRSRQWSPTKFVRVAELLRDEGWRIIEVGKRDDSTFPDVLGANLPADHSFVGKLTLRENLSLLSKVSLFLGNDSGSFHMAAAVATPQVAIFGPIPWHARAYWNTTSIFAYSDCNPKCMVDCCRQNPATSPYGKIEPCLDEIEPGRVADAVRVAYNRFVAPGLRFTRPRAGRSRPLAPVGEPAVEW